MYRAYYMRNKYNNTFSQLHMFLWSKYCRHVKQVGKYIIFLSFFVLGTFFENDYYYKFLMLSNVISKYKI